MLPALADYGAEQSTDARGQGHREHAEAGRGRPANCRLRPTRGRYAGSAAESVRRSRTTARSRLPNKVGSAIYRRRIHPSTSFSGCGAVRTGARRNECSASGVDGVRMRKGTWQLGAAIRPIPYIVVCANGGVRAMIFKYARAGRQCGSAPTARNAPAQYDLRATSSCGERTMSWKRSALNSNGVAQPAEPPRVAVAA